MPLSVGDKLGHYQVISLLGKGGMGEVYRARDTKLKREVALKVLPNAFSGDPERMARFQREAEVLASLNHPNIAQIHGVEDRALVMELVEGESPKGPMPFEEAWKIASQIADALEYAHEKGVVHRDLKPANVKITPSGTVKLLDFGLAKAFSAERPADSGDPENSPTVTMGTTEAGVILGTAAYMSPEQARGIQVDKRADVWAFGVVLYELLTGGRPFRGRDVGETLAQVLTVQPDLERAPATARRLLRDCLEKEPARRLRDIGDAERLLEVGQVSDLPAPGMALRPAWVAWAACGVLAAALATLAFVHFRPTSPTGQPMHLSIALPENASVKSLALSPDGKNLVFASRIGSSPSFLWLRGINSTELRPLSGTEGARQPFWSPDGRFIAFFAEEKLKSIPATGGPVTVLCEVAGAGGTWNRDGVILFASQGSVHRVAQTGGACAPLTKGEPGGAQSFPEFLPDGRHFFYVQSGAAQGVYLASLDDPNRRRVLADLSSVVYLPPSGGNKLGYVLFLRESTLMAQPFDDVALQPMGDVVAVANQASLSNTQPGMAASLSANGVLAYLANGETNSAPSQLTWVDRQGNEIEKVGTPGGIFSLSLSPDEKMVAFGRTEADSVNCALWMFDLIRGSAGRFASSPVGESFAPVWSPQADRIIFEGARMGSAFRDLYVKDIGGTQEELLYQNGNVKYPSDWSRDGRYVVYTEGDPHTHGDIWYLQDPLSKERKAIRFQATPFDESEGQISPDGHLIAYTSNESGQEEVYVRPFPSGDGRWPVSNKGGFEPRWRRDGKELFYLEAGLPPHVRMMAVAVTPGARQPFGPPQRLFDFRALPQVVAVNGFSYSPSANGQRFLVKALASDMRPTIDLLFNWQKALGAEDR